MHVPKKKFDLVPCVSCRLAGRMEMTQASEGIVDCGYWVLGIRYVLGIRAQSRFNPVQSFKCNFDGKYQ
jgi:hypothetical protein